MSTDPAGVPPVSRREFDALFSALRTWGRWSPADRGAWNRVTPDHVRRAAALVRDGTPVSLGLPWDTRPGPENPKPALHYMSDLGDVEPPEPATHKDFLAADCHGKGVSHLDALSHVAYRGRLYEGHAAREVIGAGGARFGAVAALGPLVTRGVLLDLPAVLPRPRRTPGKEHREPEPPRPLPVGRRAAVAVAATAALVAGCGGGGTSRGPDSDASRGSAGCPAVLAAAKAAVARAERTDAAWNGPTTGPPAAPGKSLVYVAQTMTNPGVAGAAAGVREAAAVAGWRVRVIDGEGTPAGIQAALSQAVTLRPSGIVIGGFDPQPTARQMARAGAAGIPVKSAGTPSAPPGRARGRRSSPTSRRG
ncbi:hypothetical protein [Streptomyces sp. NPDC086023]|uniref:hypothetical protein n=1 Tax=Streptomyces sp. NPDC086023 TaxID=3365746 RepID=UPI0037D10928